jgi:hypothetical protein
MPAESLVFCTLLGPEGPDLPAALFEVQRQNGPLDLWHPMDVTVSACKKAPDSCVTGLVQAQ